MSRHRFTRRVALALGLMLFCVNFASAAQTAADLANDATAKSIALEKEQKYDEAILALTSTRKPSYLVNLRLGWLYYLKADYTSSKQFYQMAMRMAPKAVEPRLGITLPLLAELRYAEVEGIARAILSLDANNYTGSLRLATSLRLQAKYRPAREVNAAMLELYPTDVTFLSEQLLVSAASKQSDVAALADSILALDPQNATALYYRTPATAARKN
jgi:tetratricopeptide (TPR) repeat protein